MEPLRQRKLTDALRRAASHHQELRKTAAGQAATHPAFIARPVQPAQEHKPESEA